MLKIYFGNIQVKYIKACLILMGIVGGPTGLFAQTILQGTVKDSNTQEVLVGVVVSIDSTQNLTTDLNGHFKTTLTKGNHTVKFTYVTYETQVIYINADGKELERNIFMSPHSEALQMTVVTASLYGKNISEENVSMEVLKAQTIENTSMREVDEAMNYVPGVQVIDNQANIRGGSGWTYGAGSRVLILVDGMPELTPDASDAIWDFLPMEQIQQIEVLKGASSVQYGSSALDGVINIRTLWPTSTPVTTFSFLQGIYANPNVGDSAIPWKGTQQPYFDQFSFMHAQKVGQLDIVASGNFANELGYQYSAFDQRVRTSLKLRYRFKHIEGLMVGVKTNYMYQNNGTYLVWDNDGAGILEPLAFKGQTTTVDGLFRRLNIDPFVNYDMPDGSRFTLQSRYFLSSNIDYGSNKGSIAQSYYYELSYQKDFKFGLTVNAGLNYTKDLVSAQLYGDHYGINSAAYVQLEQKLLNNKLTITAGVREENNVIDDSAFEKSPPVFRSGLNYAISQATHVRASFGEGYRFPSIAEKFINSNIGPVSIFPNAGLQPEFAYSGEVGVNQVVKFGNWQGYADLALFMTQFRNLIDFEFNIWLPPNPTPAQLANDYQFLGFRSINITDAEIYGTELSFGAEGKIGEVTIRFIGGFTAINPINLSQVDTVKNYEASHPGLTSGQKDSLNQTEILNYRSLYTAKFGFEATYKKFTLGGNIRYTSFMVNIDNVFEGTDPLTFGTEIIPGVAEFRASHHTGDYIIDAHFAYQMTDALKISFIVKNLLNREYMIRPGLLGPPQSFTVQLNIRL